MLDLLSLDMECPANYVLRTTAILAACFAAKNDNVTQRVVDYIEDNLSSREFLLARIAARIAEHAEHPYNDMDLAA
ncbi:MAG: hypothetical protein ACI80L_000934 [Pseudohongiellaceae bacterium]